MRVMTGIGWLVGYADYLLADGRYVFPCLTPTAMPQPWPLLCADLIGYQSPRQAGDAARLGLYGFGTPVQLARYERRQVSAITRRRDSEYRGGRDHVRKKASR